jgi:hypothetical protein
MTITPDVRTPVTSPSPGPVKRRNRWAIFAGVPAIFAAGLVGGALLPHSTVELDAATSSLRSSNAQVERLESKLAAAKESNVSLAQSVEDANDQVATASVKAEAVRKRLNARTAKLDEREHSLDQRGQALDQREQDLAVPAPAGPAEEAPSSSGDFDRAHAIDVGGDIVQEVKTVDERLGDGIAVSSALSLLSTDYGRLLDAGIPPGVKESKYYARVTTLQTFAEDAADVYDIKPMEGEAKYAVLRQETRPLLDQLNGAVNTHFELP